jgi:hypothetical protein
VGEFYSPKPEEIRRERESARLTQKEAAELVCATINTWQKWEAPEGTSSYRQMHPGFWKLFKIEISRQ